MCVTYVMKFLHLVYQRTIKIGVVTATALIIALIIDLLFLPALLSVMDGEKEYGSNKIIKEKS